MLVFTFGVFLKPHRRRIPLVARSGVACLRQLRHWVLQSARRVLGTLLDRFGPRRIILPCLTVFGLAFASLSLLRGPIVVLYLTFRAGRGGQRHGAIGAQPCGDELVYTAAWTGVGPNHGWQRHRCDAVAAGIAQALVDRYGMAETVAALGRSPWRWGSGSGRVYARSAGSAPHEKTATTAECEAQFGLGRSRL